MKKSNVIAIAIIISTGLVAVDTQAAMQSIQEKAKAAGKKAWQHKGKIAIGAGTAAAIAGAIGAGAYLAKSTKGKLKNYGIELTPDNLKWAQAAEGGINGLTSLLETGDFTEKELNNYILNEDFRDALAGIANIPLNQLPFTTGYKAKWKS